MGPLVENLCELGYNDNNLICAPYDWRVPFYYLEERSLHHTHTRTHAHDTAHAHDIIG
jgi:hypothetical protein